MTARTMHDVAGSGTATTSTFMPPAMEGSVPLKLAMPYRKAEFRVVEPEVRRCSYWSRGTDDFVAGAATLSIRHKPGRRAP